MSECSREPGPQAQKLAWVDHGRAGDNVVVPGSAQSCQCRDDRGSTRIHVNCYHKETHAQIPVIMRDILLWLTLFRPHPVPKMGQPSSDKYLSHRILLWNLEYCFAVIAFHMYPGPSCGMIGMVESSLQVGGVFRAFTVHASRAFVKPPHVACLLGISFDPNVKE